jgi:hypothetical protein
MKFILFLIGILIASFSFSYEEKVGDIVFQTSLSKQSTAVQLATNSPYSHMGIILRKKDGFYVLEAVQTVKFTPLKEWLNRGKNKHYVIKRLKKEISSEEASKIQDASKKYFAKLYDLTFEWSDEKIYCSELVWKLYKDALNIELAPLNKLSSFNLSNPIIKAKLKERYGDNVPLNEWVIAPVALFESSYLKTVDEH